MKAFILLIFLSNGFAFFSQSSEKMLRKAYRKNSTELLDQFFFKWESEIPPINQVEFLALNDTIKAVNTVYEEFIKWKKIENPKYKYVFIQNSLSIYFAEKVYFTKADLDSVIIKNINLDSTLSIQEKKEYLIKEKGKFNQIVRDIYTPALYELIVETDTIKIKNFRPNLKMNNQILYLNEDYSKIIEDFLSKEKNDDRKLFLEKYFKIDAGGFKFYPKDWYFKPDHTCNMTFDAKMEFVKIDYGSGNVVYFKCINGKWIYDSDFLEYIY
jgi:hypothetical protein